MNRKTAFMMVEMLDADHALDAHQCLIDSGDAWTGPIWLTRQAADLIERGMCTLPDRCAVPREKLKEQVIDLQLELDRTINVDEQAGLRSAVALLCTMIGASIDRSLAYRRVARALRGQVSGFLVDRTGVTSIEYALIAAGIAVVIIPAVMAVGAQLATTFTTISTQLGTAGF